MPTNIGYLQAILGLNTSGLERGIARANRSLAGMGKAMQSIGKTMSMALTLPLAAAGVGAVKLAADFEKSMSKIEGLVGIAGDKVQAMRGDIMSLAGQTAKAPEELADAMFFITSAGLRGADAVQALEMSAKAATAGLGETKVVADLVTSAMNAYGSANLNAQQATDILVATVREGKAEAPALAASMGQVLPIASAMGVGFDQVGAAIASMTRTGTAAETASMQLKNILASILSPAQQAEEALQMMGKSSMELRQQIRDEGLLSVLQWLATRVHENQSAAESLVSSMGAAFPNIRALSGALDLMGSNAADNVAIFGRMTDSTGMLESAFGAAANTASFKFNQALAQLKVSAIEMGSMLLPIAVKIVNALKNLVTWFSGLSATGKAATLAIGGIVALAGPALAFFGTMATIIAGLVSPIGLVVLGVVALGAAILYLWDNWKAIKERISDWSWWKNMLIDMAQFLLNNNIFSWIIDGYNALMMAVGRYDKLITNPFEKLSDKLEELKDPIEEREHQFTSFGETVKNAMGKARDALAGLFNSASGGGGGGGGGSTGGSTGGGTTTSGGIASLLPSVLLPGGAPGTGAPEFLGKAREGIASTTKAVMELGTAMQNTLNDAFAEFGETLGGLFSGDAGATNFFQGILTVVAGFMKTFGKALIAAGTAALAFEKLLINPIAAIAAGIALIATAAVVTNLLKKGPGGGKPQGLASGGFVTSGGVFKVGEKGEELVSLPRGAAVTPNNVLQGGQMVRVTGQIVGRGSDMLVLIKNAEYEENNVGG